VLLRLFDRFRTDLAVDLGTVNTLLGVPGEGIVVDEPTVVAVDRATGRVLSGGAAVGLIAKQMEGRTPEGIRVIRPMRDGVITDFRLCEALVRHFLRKARRSAWRLKPRLIVGVPGCITPVERRAVFGSLLRAGAGKVWILPEAMAAAVGAALPIAEPVASMICDIGGGTTEIAVISLGETVSGESIRIGGDAMDKAVLDYLKRHFSLRISLPAAERLRIEIGSAYPLEQELTAEANGLDAVTGLPRKATVTSEEIREALLEPLEKILEATRDALDRCTPDLAADLVNCGITLCGGGALLRRIDRYFHEHTGLPVRLAAAPLTTVVEGLLLCLEQFDRWRPLLESSDDDA
jgi:rod shape-determining protein MreB and related proteins